MLGNTRPYVNENTSLQLYKTLIMPLFDYVSPAYNCLSQKDSYTLQKIQNCALRIVSKRYSRSHVAEMHRDLKMHYLSDRHHMLTLCQVYKCIHDIAPRNICKQVSLKQNVNERTTRSGAGLELHIPRLNLETSRRAFKYRGPWYWNMLEPHIQGAESLPIFKYRLYSSDMFAPV